MPTQITYPGVYIQELPSGTHTVTGVATSIAAFVGCLGSGDFDTPVLCQSFADFETAFGGLDAAFPASFQVYQFFLNGGTEAWVSRVRAASYPPTGAEILGSATNGTGIYALDIVDQVNLLVLPDLPAMDSASYLTAAANLLNYAVARRAFAVLDLPADVASVGDAVSWANTVPATFGNGIVSAAAYFPQVIVPQPNSTVLLSIGPSGTMAGIYAATDVSRGVWKAPAGITDPLAGVTALAGTVTDAGSTQLNPAGINALRTFPTYGNVPWGARTLAAPNIADEDWKYVPVRRLALYIEQSLIQGLQWTVFEPNDAKLWAQIGLSATAFLEPLFQQGAFAGSSSADSFQVSCDATTTTPEDIANGFVNLLVLIAPVQPAEFIVINLQLIAGQAAS